MSDRQEIEQAIGALEAQRSILGDAATDAALDGLRQRLAELTGESKQGSIPAPETQGERRIVTVLFCDVTGSTALAESMDPEAWTEIMNAIFEHLIEPVERFGGTIARLMGDAILAFFGAPIAHEDDPQRAVLAGVAIIEEIQPFREQLQREKGLSFDVRVGINTGLVVVGEVGSQTAGEYTAMGDAVNLAARMEQTAAPGTVQVSEETYRYVAPLFEWQELGPVAVKGKAEPVQTFQPLARKKQPGPVRGLATHGISSPLIGRERELRALREAGAHLPEEHGALVSIVGAAGLGKSRLVAEFRREGLTGESNAPNWLEAHALSHAGSSVYFSWQQIIRHSLGADESDAPATVRTRLEAICTRIGLPDEHVPYLALLLAVADEGSSKHANMQEGEALARHIRQAIGEYLQRLSQESPLVLVLDDLHWADSASVALLDNLAPLVLAHPILILALYRPDLDAESWHFREAAAEKLGRSHVEIQLHPLPKDSSLAMLENLLLAQTLPESFLELIFQRSGGNPLFIEEVIRTLLDKGVLTEEESGWVLVQEVDDIEIPGNLQAMLVARIDRLEEVTRRTLQIASVIGTSFYFRVLSQLAGAITHLEQKVSSLERADLVRLEAQLPELEYAFRHVLIQEAAYATLLRRERRALHRRAAEALEQLFADSREDLAPLLATHFDRADMTTKAVQYYVMAGDAAYKLFANADAAAHYGRAVAVLNRDPASVASVPAETLKRLYVQRGRALELTQRFSDAIQNYQELRAWGEQQDASELALAAQLSLAVVTSTTGPAYDSEMSRLAGQSALALARRLGDREAEARALWALFLRGWATGWGQEVIGYGEASLAIAQELALPEQIALTSGDLALAYLSVGALDKASAMLEGAIRFWRQLGNVVMLTNSLAVWSLLGINFAEYELLLERAGEVYELNERIGNIWGQGSGGFLRGVCYVEAAQYGMAIGSMEEIVELTRSGRLGMMEAICRGYLGWVYSHVGATEAALTEARAAHRLSESERGENNRWLTAILVMIFAEEGDLDMADRCLEACLAGFEPTNLSSPAPLFVMLAKARRHFVVKQYDQCLAESEALFALQARFKLENLRADALALKAEVLLVQGDHEAAAELLAQARAQAEAFGIRRILWRIMGLQAEAAAGRDEQPAGVRQTRSDGFRREAGELIEAIANDIDMPHHRESFLAQPAVRRILLPGRHD